MSMGYLTGSGNGNVYGMSDWNGSGNDMSMGCLTGSGNGTDMSMV